MREWFETVREHVHANLTPDEGFTILLSGERSAFARLNSGRVRQPGSVTQCNVSLRLLSQGRQASYQFGLSGDKSTDLKRTASALSTLRSTIAHLPADPHLLVATEVSSSEEIDRTPPPDAAEMVDALVEAAGDTDLVGIVAAGTLYRGFANHLGQQNWFERSSYNLDWCLVHEADKAVKSSLAGFVFDRNALEAELARGKARLDILRRPNRNIAPGQYRAWLSPSALNEVLGVLSWGGFGLKALETGNSALRRFWSGQATLSPMVTMFEDVAGGIAPDFQGDGFRCPDRVSLFEDGRMVGALVSPRSAQEYGRSTTGADGGEQPNSLAMAGGNIPEHEVLERLGTGLYIGNLWYTNFSDRAACRITGMTRFATFWVEGGEIVAPVAVMRFDDTLGHLLGDGLVGLSDTPTFLPSNQTYFERSTQSARLPGALVEGMRFTL